MALPTGTVTFLLTDIERSVQLWEESPEAMHAALARHDALVIQVVAGHSGAVVKGRGEGDSLFAVFARATDAVTAACALQTVLLEEPWPAAAALRVRVALHTGEADLRDGDYYGPAVNRCARLRDAGHGGQVLLSLATEQIVRDHLPPGTALRDLGEHRLRDLTHPERIFQFVGPGLPNEFPSLRTLGAHPNNLPAQRSSLVGREAQAAEARALLLREDVGLVTFTGPGGTGKTRLAMHLGEGLLEQFEAGVFFVPLGAITDSSLVPSAVAQVLGVREEGSRPLLGTLKDFLRDRRLLLILDNFEQVTSAARLVIELLDAAPRLKVLVTSRARLHLRGEQEFSVPPLELPDLTCLPEPEELLGYPAVALFVERAAAVRPDFTLTRENAAAVASICSRLDGLPLAIELAAARSRLLPPQAMLARFDAPGGAGRSPLRVLTGGARDLPARQQTLRGAIAWSYHLLDEPDRALFRRLSVFVGGFTPEAAEVVCGDEPGEMDVLTGLETLLDNSLLRQQDLAAWTDPAGEPRLAMLETIREFAREQLRETAAGSEAPDRQRRHADYFRALAERAEPELQGPDQSAWLHRLEADHGNLRAALEWCTSQEDGALGLQLAGALGLFWEMRGHFAGGRALLEAVLTRSGGSRTRSRAKALNMAGNLARDQGDYSLAHSYYNESLEISRELQDKPGIAASLNNLGNVARSQGGFVLARSFYEESLAIRRELGDRSSIAASLHNLGNVTIDLGDYAAARPLYEESLAMYRSLRDQRGMAYSLECLGLVASGLGDYPLASALCQECLSLARELGDPWGLALSLGNLATVAYHQGDLALARSCHHESLSLLGELGDKRGIAYSLEGFATLAQAERRPEHAARLFGAAEALRMAIGAPLPAGERDEYSETVSATRRALGETIFRSAWAGGGSLTPQQAAVYALEFDDGEAPPEPGSGGLPAPAGD